MNRKETWGTVSPGRTGFSLLCPDFSYLNVYIYKCFRWERKQTEYVLTRGEKESEEELFFFSLGLKFLEKKFKVSWTLPH